MLEPIEIAKSPAVPSVQKTRLQNKTELHPVLLVKQDKSLMRNGLSVVRKSWLKLISHNYELSNTLSYIVMKLKPKCGK